METALLKVQNDILIEMDKGKVIALVLLDLRCAFDTVDHNILIDRLKRLALVEHVFIGFVPTFQIDLKRLTFMIQLHRLLVFCFLCPKDLF